MIVNFYDESGVMAGLDPHAYYTIGPKGIPFPVLDTKHVVGITFYTPVYLPRSGKVLKVTTEGCATFQRRLRFCLIPHVPLTKSPPHPVEVGIIAAIILLSRSEIWISVDNVTFGGGRAATCVASAIGNNSNCKDVLLTICAAATKTNVVVNFNTVQTDLSLVDFVGKRIAGWVFALDDMAVGAGGAAGASSPAEGHVTEALIRQVWGRASHLAAESVEASLGDAPERLAKMIEQWVD